MPDKGWRVFTSVDKIMVRMSSITEIEAAVRQLSPQDLAKFREWFSGFDGQLWDRQIEADSKGGRLDQLAEEALRDVREGRCTDL